MSEIEITAQDVKKLRDQTGAGFADCKKALVAAAESIEDSGELMQVAEDLIRKQGRKDVAKKSERATGEGVVTIAVSDDRKIAACVVVTCETDFVARGDDFQSFVKQIAGAALAHSIKDVPALGEVKVGDSSIEEMRCDLIAKIGENIRISKIEIMQSAGCIGSYVHSGKMAALVALDIDNAELARDLAMHVVASGPVAIDRGGLDEAWIQREENLFTEQAQEIVATRNLSGDAATQMAAGILKGKMAKRFDEVTLIGQGFVKNPDEKVSKILADAGASVEKFVRLIVGE